MMVLNNILQERKRYSFFKKLRQLLAELTYKYDYIVIDCPTQWSFSAKVRCMPQMCLISRKTQRFGFTT